MPEQRIGHVVDMARASLLHQHVPKYLWGEAVLIAFHLKNQTPARNLSYSSPLDILSNNYKDIPLMMGLKPKLFGCKAFVHALGPGRDKLDQRAIECVMMGYSPAQKGYKCFDPKIRTFFISTNVTFNESQPYFQCTKPDSRIPLTLEESWAKDIQITPYHSAAREEDVTGSQDNQVSSSWLEDGEVAKEDNIISEDAGDDLGLNVEAKIPLVIEEERQFHDTIVL